MRRVRRTETSKSSLQHPGNLNVNIKKSISMDSVPSTELRDEDNNPKLSEPSRDQETEQTFEELVKIIDNNGNGNLSASYSTLPQSFSRSRNISRSLVPKMRKFFEKSRSCDPELTHGKMCLDREAGSVTRPTDGTESARSSFVLLAPGHQPGDGGATNSVSSSSLTLEDGSEDRARQMKNKGFVNKCVVKVRSLMGRSQEWD